MMQRDSRRGIKLLQNRRDAPGLFRFCHGRTESNLAKGVDAGDLLAEHQRVNVVRAFIGLDRLEVAHVAHHRVGGGNAVGA